MNELNSFKKLRTEGVTIACPIVYGSVAYWMGRKADEFATHKWTLYIRGPNGEDLSCFISRVVFTLHSSFEIPLREVTDSPFQVSEFGWGEFEAGIRIFFRDLEEQPIDLIHQIRLYPPGGSLQASNNTSKKPVVSESYDEIVFTNPTEGFKRLLLQYTPPETPLPASITEYYTKFDDDSDLQQLYFIQDHLNREIDVAKTRLLQLDSELNYLTMNAPPPGSIIAFNPEGSFDDTDSVSGASGASGGVMGGIANSYAAAIGGGGMMATFSGAGINYPNFSAGGVAAAGAKGAAGKDTAKSSAAASTGKAAKAAGGKTAKDKDGKSNGAGTGDKTDKPKRKYNRENKEAKAAAAALAMAATLGGAAGPAAASYFQQQVQVKSTTTSKAKEKKAAVAAAAAVAGISGVGGAHAMQPVMTVKTEPVMSKIAAATGYTTASSVISKPN